MEMMELMKSRHSVRRQLEKQIAVDLRTAINKYSYKTQEDSGLNIKVCYDEPRACKTRLALYGSFRNAINYIAFVGKKEEETKVGYYGEAIVLKLQELGVNTCWVAVSYSKRKTPLKINKGETILCVISFGYG